MLLAYDIGGDGPPLVLINGFALDRRCWDECLPTLALTHRIVRCELRGCGATPAPSGPYRHADDVHELIGELGLGPAVVVGLSMGGGVALDLARDHPESVRALALVGSDVPGIPMTREITEMFMSVIEEALAGDLVRARDVWMTSPFVSRTDPDVTIRVRAMLDDYDGFHWTTRDPHFGVRTGPEHLSDIPHPTLVVWGEHEGAHMIEKSRLLERRLANARGVVVPGAGHLVCMEQPAALCAAILAFLDALRDDALSSRDHHPA